VMVMCPGEMSSVLDYSCNFSLGEHHAYDLAQRRLVGALPTGRCSLAAKTIVFKNVKHKVWADEDRGGGSVSSCAPPPAPCMQHTA